MSRIRDNQRRLAAARPLSSRVSRRVATVIPVALLLSACGQGGTGVPEGTPAAAPSTPPAAGSALTISVTQPGGTTTWRLTCEPPGGDHPHPVDACQALDQVAASALPPVPADRVCAQVIAGPETATVTGSWRGQPVDSRLSRTDSCQVARWDALAPVLQP